LALFRQISASAQEASFEYMAAKSCQAARSKSRSAAACKREILEAVDLFLMWKRVAGKIIRACLTVPWSEYKHNIETI